MILPRYFLDRVYLPSSTPGSMYDIDHETLICKTLEPAWRNNNISEDPAKASCIEEGVTLWIWQPPGHGRPYEYFRCIHAPGRHWHPDTRASSVLMHTGNTVEHSIACILPGSRHADINLDGVPDVVDSTKKLLWMTKNLPKYFELEIRQKQR